MAFNTRLAWASLLITRIHLWVAQESNIQRIQAILHNTWWMDHCQVRLRSLKAIPILDPVDVAMAYSYSASGHHSIQSHVRSYGWHYASFGEVEYPMERRLILRREVCETEAVKILFWNCSNDRPSSHLSTHCRSFPEAPIVWEVAQANGAQSWWQQFV